MATAAFGHFQEFQPGSEPISAYLERMQAYLDAHGVDEEKRSAILVSVIGSKTYAVLRSLMAPDTPQAKPFEALAEILKRHYEPAPLIIAERYTFNQRNQRPEESVSEYVAELRRLAATCKFGDFLEDALRDRLVCGLRSESARRRLLADADGEISLSKAIDQAQKNEQAEINSRSLKAGEPSIKKLSAAHSNRPSTGGTQQQRKTCYRCNRPNHAASECRFINATCNYCNKKGHIAPACKKKIANERKSNTHSVVDTSDAPDGDDGVFFLNKVGNRTGDPIVVNLDIEGKLIPMEVDTGAAFSVISEKTYKNLLPEVKLRRSTIKLKTYTEERIPVVGQLHVHVSYGTQKAPLVLLVVAGEGPTLMGRNWLKYIRLDWKSIHQITSDSPKSSELRHLLDKYEEIFNDELGTIKNFRATLEIREGVTPRFQRVRPVPFAIKATIEEELDSLERSGAIEKVSHSRWAAPIVAVPKKNGKLRICGDYKVTINPVLIVDQYPLPTPEQLFSTLTGGTKFTTLDLSQAYQQLLLDEQSREYVTINTHRGLYRYTRLPFGVASAPAMFQKLMDTVLQGIPQVICYIDDILVTGKTDEEHLRNLAEVFKRLQECGFRLKRAKCSFLRDSVVYLGHKIDAEGLHTTPEKVAAVVDGPPPTNVSELRAFLGMVNYYRKFIPNLSARLHPLNSLLQPSKRWKWSDECEKAFLEAKQSVASTPVLAHYDPTQPLTLAGDASAYGIGAVISHVLPDGSEKPIAFASRSLSPSERNYAQLEKEALSLVYGVKRFHQYLYGRKFQLITDHKPLLAILGPKKGIPALAAARLQRWAILLSAYTYDIKFKSTLEHANADGLSRLPLPETPSDEPGATSVFNISQIEALPVTSAAIARATRRDRILSKVHRYVRTEWPKNVEAPLKPFQQRQHELTVQGDCVLWGIRVVVPEKYQHHLLQELHRDHQGVSRMKSLARSFIWWPGLDADIEDLAKACTECQQNKHLPPQAPLHPWTWPKRPWERIHIDFAGPFMGTSFLVIVDAHSKWLEVFEMSTISTTKTITRLRGLFASYGLPEQVVSDNGTQFTSEEFQKFMRENGIKHTKIAPYHPSSNGAVERFNQTFKQALRAGSKESRSLSHRLADFLLAYRTTPHATTGRTPSSLFLNRDVRTRFSLVQPNVAEHVNSKQASEISRGGHREPRTFQVRQRVWVKDYRPSQPNWIAATVVDAIGPLTYRVLTDSGITWKRHIDQIRERLSDKTNEVADTLNAETTDSFEILSPNEPTETVTTPPTPAESETNGNEENTTERRYPQRARNRPDRLMYT